MRRRDFIVRGTLAGAGLSLLDVQDLLGRPTRRDTFRFEAAQQEVAMRALDAARAAGATYADVRINRNRTQQVSTRERQITGLGAEREWRSPSRSIRSTSRSRRRSRCCSRANEAALGVAGARFVTSSMFFLREEKFYANTEGTSRTRRSTVRSRT
jgi:predicted Zn-dependent protease